MYVCMYVCMYAHVGVKTMHTMYTKKIKFKKNILLLLPSTPVPAHLQIKKKVFFSF
jgi:hypothetical protein